MMPNKTIYVADADLPVFERAQQLAGDNLSSTIAQALKRFVESQEAKEEGFEEITVTVGKVAYSKKRFVGRLLASGYLGNRFEPEHQRLNVYQTSKGKLALHIRRGPNFGSSPRSEVDSEDWNEEPNEYRLEVYDTLDELKAHIPTDLYDAVAQALTDDSIEMLDI
jgi:EXLDI family protein